MGEIYRNWSLPFGLSLRQYWAGEVILERGNWKRYIKMPWHRTIVSTQWRMADRSWMERPYPAVVWSGPPLFLWNHPGTWRKEYPYTYTTKYGDEQHSICTVWHARTKRRPHWLRWLPIGRWQEEIEFEFSEEMGSEAGSWKGGVVGSSQSILPGETVDQCVARMMRERTWCR